MLAGTAVKVLAAYLSPSRRLIGSDLDTCFGGGMPVLKAVDINAKHVDWNFRLTTGRGKLLRDYADRNTCLTSGPDSPTTNPYNPFATPDALDIVKPRVSHPQWLTSCSTLSSDHPPVLIDTGCRSSFHHPPNRSNVMRTDWATFQTHLEAEIPLKPELQWQGYRRVLRTTPAPSFEPWQLPPRSVASAVNHAPRSRPAFRTKYA